MVNYKLRNEAMHKGWVVLERADLERSRVASLRFFIFLGNHGVPRVVEGSRLCLLSQLVSHVVLFVSMLLQRAPLLSIFTPEQGHNNPACS